MLATVYLFVHMYMFSESMDHQLFFFSEPQLESEVQNWVGEKCFRSRTAHPMHELQTCFMPQVELTKVKCI